MWVWMWALLRAKTGARELSRAAGRQGQDTKVQGQKAERGMWKKEKRGKGRKVFLVPA